MVDPEYKAELERKQRLSEDQMLETQLGWLLEGRNDKVLATIYPPWRMTRIMEARGYRPQILIENNELMVKFSRFKSESVMMRPKPETGYREGFMLVLSSSIRQKPENVLSVNSFTGTSDNDFEGTEYDPPIGLGGLF